MQPIETISAFLFVLIVMRQVIREFDWHPDEYPGPVRGYRPEQVLTPAGMRQFVSDMVEYLADDPGRLQAFLSGIDPMYHPAKELPAAATAERQADESSPAYIPADGPAGEWSVQMDMDKKQFTTKQLKAI